MLVPLRFVVVMGTVKMRAPHAFPNVTVPVVRTVLQEPFAFPMTPLLGIVPVGVPTNAVVVLKNPTTSKVVCAPELRFHVVVTDNGALTAFEVKLSVVGVTDTVKLEATVAVKATVAVLD